jgi:predicted DNA-binding ribbon-helix-helix protein
MGQRKTSVSLEEEFWLILKQIAQKNACTVSQLVSNIDESRSSGNLSSTLRLFVLAQFRPEARQEAR